MTVEKPFVICKVRFICQVRRSGTHSGFLGEGIRASFGDAIRHAIGCDAPDNNCSSCANRFGCPYLLVFKPNLLTKNDIELLFPHCPDTKLTPPYAIDMTCHVRDSPRHTYFCSDRFDADLSIFGFSGMLFLPLLIQAFRSALEDRLHHGSFLEVHQVTDFFSGAELPDSAAKMFECLTPFDWTSQQFADDAQRAQIAFDAPLEIARNKSFVTEVDLSLLMERIALRAKSMILTYSDQNYEKPDCIMLNTYYHQIKQQSDFHLAQFEPYGPRNSFGIIGTLDLEGPLTPLLKHLNLGSLLHIGKHATVGYGAFTLRL